MNWDVLCKSHKICLVLSGNPEAIYACARPGICFILIFCDCFAGWCVWFPPPSADVDKKPCCLKLINPKYHFM